MGDNIYAYVNIASLIVNSGDQDHDWDAKFYSPYRELLQHIPFHPSLGNHDGNGSESRGDLTVYLDNFFFPENRPARYYTFSFGGLADFFALDSTEIPAPDRPRRSTAATRPNGHGCSKRSGIHGAMEDSILPPSAVHCRARTPIELRSLAPLDAAFRA